MKPTVLVALPALNEAENFIAVALELTKTQRACEPRDLFDVLLVDDGSTDNTAAIPKALGWDVLRHLATKGYGASLATAFSYARAHTYRHIVTMDADGQHPPNAI